MLRDAGFDLKQLREAGFYKELDAKQLRDVGFDLKQLRDAGFDLKYPN